MTNTTPVVGIGTSAGGLEALQAFVKAIPPDSGICYVIVPHLSPEQPSLMDKLLSAHAPLQVRRIEDGDPMTSELIHIIPPGSFLEISEGRFRLIPHPPEHGVRTPIDRFFASMAEQLGRDAFAVVLSGTGSDGTTGVRAIKANGGFAIVQESASARFPSMPESASATGLVDLVLRPADMPHRIHEIVEHRSVVEHEDRQDLLDSISQQLGAVLERLEKSNHGSFNGYKPGTLVRRIARRMALLRLRSVADYVKRLDEHPEECHRLANDFLISVTEFFRDPEVFETLKQQALRKLLASKRENFRIWVPGCASGEEVFSIAILVAELAEEFGDRRPWKIFGTDIDVEALRQARSGRFPGAALEKIGKARLERFFTKDGDTWQINPGLREMCVFAPQNLLQDPPFSRLDLISCRNVMIYLDTASQSQIVPRFHYALNPGGYLLLGPSETLGRNENLFRTIDRGGRIFLRDDEQSAGYSPLQTGARRPSPLTVRPPNLAVPSPPPPSESVEGRSEQLFLRNLAAPFATVASDNSVRYLSEAMTRFVRPSRGAVGTRVDDLFAPELRLPAQSVLSEVRESGNPASATDVVVEIEGTRRLYDVSAVPFEDEDELVLLSLAEVRPLDTSAPVSLNARSDRTESELAHTRKRLDSLQREYESAEQELRSTNEELLSMNEELQSSNEELETSREELQSINEELETINAELTENNRQLVRANSDLKNLLEATEIATLFLDEVDCVRLFTPALKRLFSVQHRDIGRPISDLAAHVEYPELLQDAEQVRRTLQPIERELSIPRTDETFQALIRPYRTIDNRIDGVVMAFVDVTQRKRSEREVQDYAAQLAEQNIELGAIYDGVPIGLSLVDSDMRWLRVNTTMAAFSGLPPKDHIGRPAEELLPGFSTHLVGYAREVLADGQPRTSVRITSADASDPANTRDHLCDFFPLERDGRIFAIGISVRDVTREYYLEREARESRAQLERMFDQVPAQIGVFEGPEHRNTYLNAEAKSAAVDRLQDGVTLIDAFPQLRGTALLESFDEVYRTGQPVVMPELRDDLSRLPGSDFKYLHLELQPWYTGAGSVGGVMSFAFDITTLVRTRNEIQAIYDCTPLGLALIDRDRRWIRVNPKLAEFNNLPAEDHVGRALAQIMPRVAEEIAPQVEAVFDSGDPAFGIEITSATAGAPETLRNFLFDLFPVVIEGNVYAVGAAVRDVTRETALSAGLRESELRLRRLFDQAPAAIAVLEGPEHRFIYSNPAHDDAAGRPDLVGRPLREAIPEIAGQGIYERFDRVYETGEPFVSNEIEAEVMRGIGNSLRTNYYQQIIQPWFAPDGSVAGTMVFNLDITPQVEARKEARNAARRLQRLLDGLFTFVGLVSPEGILLEVNEPALQRGGVTRDEVVGHTFWEAYWWSYDEGVQRDLQNAVRRAAQGETLRYDVLARTAGDNRILIDFQLTPSLDENGQITEIIASAVDVTERAMAEERKDVLLAELEHRVKNTLAVVQSIARFTGRTAPDKDEMVKRLMRRLAAIARTHEALTLGEWQEHGLRDLAATEISPYVGQDTPRYGYHGPDAALTPAEAMSLGLAIHELATNAAKYGAFSNDRGRVDITVEGDGRTFDRLTWQETGGPEVTQPHHTGFGSFLVGTLLERQLQAQVTMDYRPAGLICTIRLKQDANEQQDDTYAGR